MDITGTAKAVIALVILLVLLGVGYYVSNMKSALEQSEQNNKVLTTSINAQQKTLDKLNEDIEAKDIIVESLQEVIQIQQSEIDNLNEKFNTSANGHSRDFGAITRAKPGLVNKIINRATDNVARCFELATGAELKEGENNNECKNLINSISK